MSTQYAPVAQDAAAVTIARAHVEAWSNHDWANARLALAADVHVTATTTQPTMPTTHLTGIDDYMHGLKEFAQPVTPGSARVLATVGHDRNALLVVAVDADFGAGPITLTAARLYLLDEDDKIKAEQVIFFIAPN